MMTIGGDWIRALGRRFAAQQPITGSAIQDRLASYRLFQAYYDNRIYDLQLYGGQREILNSLLGADAASDLSGIYNPVSQVVDLYQHVFGGEFGSDITAIPGPKADRILDPLKQVWTWSNLNVRKQEICQIGPTCGAIGLRIVADNDVVSAKRRVYIKPEHPETILDVSYDTRGNIKAVLLQYDIEAGLDENKTVTTLRELQTKDAFTLWTVVDGRLTPYDSYPNLLGVVPYVIVHHSPPKGGMWGLNAFYRVLPALDRLNFLIAHINKQIIRHVRATWLIEGTGAAPSAMDMSGNSILYVNSGNSIGKTAATPMVAPLSLADSIAEARMIVDFLEDALPELKATGGKFLSNQSGETVAQLRKPAEDRLQLARTNYEDGMVRAQQIALSLGVLYGLWDLGTGSDTRAAADAAYQGGYETHTFNTRGLLPLTEMERVQVVTAKQQAGISRRRSLLGFDGMSEQDVIDNEAELRDQQAAVATQFSAAFNAGQVGG
jgi:hypothetical protein